MKKTITLNELLRKAEKIANSKTNNFSKEEMKPSEKTIQRILNFSKSLASFDTKISDEKALMVMN